MKTSHIFLLSLAATTVLATAAQSEERWPRWYVGLSGTVTFVDESDFSGNGANADVDFDTGFGGLVSLGYLPPVSQGFFSNTRLELEGGYRKADFDSISAGGVSAAANGEYHITTAMLNGYYDFESNAGNGLVGWSPYVGLGLGWAQVEIDTPNSLGSTDSRDNVFAYQGMIGLGYSPAALPQTQWNIGYRYFATQDPGFSNAGGTFEGEVDTHNIEAGFKARF